MLVWWQSRLEPMHQMMVSLMNDIVSASICSVTRQNMSG